MPYLSCIPYIGCSDHHNVITPMGVGHIALLLRLASSTLLATLCCGFTLTAILWTLITSSTPGLRQNTILLNLAVELLECRIKRFTGVNFYLAHRNYQRDLRLLLRPAP